MSGPADDIPDDFVQQGAWGRIRYAIDANGNMPAKDFIEELTPPELRKLAVLFERMAEVGQIRHPEQFKKVEGRVFEFKRHQIRVGCFQEGRTWFLTQGFRKKRMSWPKSEIERANRIMNEHRQRAQRQ